MIALDTCRHEVGMTKLLSIDHMEQDLLESAIGKCKISNLQNRSHPLEKVKRSTGIKLHKAIPKDSCHRRTCTRIFACQYL